MSDQRVEWVAELTLAILLLAPLIKRRQPDAPANGGWTDGQLTESGKYVRKLLRTHCQ